MLNPNDLTTTEIDVQGMSLPWGLLERLFVSIEDSYRPRRLNSRGVLFRTDPRDNNQAVRDFDSSLGWKNLFTGGLEIIPMIGDHLSMIREHNSILAQEMNKLLQRHWPSQYDKVGIDAHEAQQVSRGLET
jgi:hypothetical protein